MRKLLPGTESDPQKIRWLRKITEDIPTVMHRKLLASLMILGIMSSEDYLILLHLFLQSVIFNAIGYIEVLKLWITSVARRRQHFFQQNSAPSHTVRTIQ